MKVVVTGMIATFPVGGVAWDYGQYALGLLALGCEVTYLEDTGWEAYDPRTGTYGPDAGYGVAALGAWLPQLDARLAGRWHHRDMAGRTSGLTHDETAEAVAQADVLLNVSGAALLRPAWRTAARTVLVDTDPGWNHFRNWPRWDANPGWQGAASWRDHDVFLTYAEQVGSPTCRLPDLGVRWHPTRPPVLPERWDDGSAPGEAWTTVMTWKNFNEEVTGPDGTPYGTKEVHFGLVEDLPRRLPGVDFEVAAGGDPPVDRWRAKGWRTRRSEAVSTTPAEYAAYLRGSRGELSVAKDLYVATCSGWSSCRSTCYLAAGRPVVLQDTGWSAHVPSGDGLLAFTDAAGAEAAVRRVEADLAHHATSARQVAAEHFDARRVLADLLDRAVG